MCKPTSLRPRIEGKRHEHEPGGELFQCITRLCGAGWLQECLDRRNNRGAPEAGRSNRREAEVLLFVCYRKASKIFSEILGISERTVSKHLEQVLRKLG
jgi:DNA-binding CsgD family transcriptional regulator